MRSQALPKTKEDSQKLNQSDSKAKPARPPILKLFLRSPTDKALAIRYKSNLQYGPEWMQTSSVRPSLPLAERQRREELLAVARARNGSNPPKTDRFLVWLNPRSERYELRQVKNGDWVPFADVKKPLDMELVAAKAAVQKRLNERGVMQRKSSAADSRPLNSQ